MNEREVKESQCNYDSFEVLCHSRYFYRIQGKSYISTSLFPFKLMTSIDLSMSKARSRFLIILYVEPLFTSNLPIRSFLPFAFPITLHQINHPDLLPLQLFPAISFTSFHPLQQTFGDSFNLLSKLPRRYKDNGFSLMAQEV